MGSTISQGKENIFAFTPQTYATGYARYITMLSTWTSSSFIMQGTESILMITFNTSLQKYGSDLAVGAMTILSTVMQFTLLPLMGLSQGAQPIISYNFGARNSKRVKSALWHCLKLR